MSFNTLNNKERLLIKRTAWVNMNKNYDAPRTPKDVEDNWTAVRVVVLVGCLNYAMIDLQESLEESGRFRHLIKRNFNNASRCVEAMHGELYKLINTDNTVAGRCYNELSDNGWYGISDNVKLSGLERSYNIVLSLSRLICHYHKKIRSRFWYPCVDKIGYVLSMLEPISETDYNLDFCVDKSVVIR